MVRVTAAAIALVWTASSASEGYAAPPSGARQSPSTGAALITHCFKMAHGIVPRRIRDRSAPDAQQQSETHVGRGDRIDHDDDHADEVALENRIEPGPDEFSHGALLWRQQP